MHGTNSDILTTLILKRDEFWRKTFFPKENSVAMQFLYNITSGVIPVE
jgi:hypothetical protein